MSSIVALAHSNVELLRGSKRSNRPELELVLGFQLTCQHARPSATRVLFTDPPERFDTRGGDAKQEQAELPW